jgi:hypothetical protein
LLQICSYAICNNLSPFNSCSLKKHLIIRNQMFITTGCPPKSSLTLLTLTGGFSLNYIQAVKNDATWHVVSLTGKP